MSVNALPVGTPESVVNRAKAVFSCSLSKNTQNNYATAIRHLYSAEAKLGRKFSIPMTEAERTYFTLFLIERGVKRATISGYLSALKHYELSKGVPKPSENSSLVKHLLTGHENLQRDPGRAILQKQRRPITGQILKLLGHSIATSGRSDYEQSLLWLVCLVAFWGSFRIVSSNIHISVLNVEYYIIDYINYLLQKTFQ